jgi:hypothetical protein
MMLKCFKIFFPSLASVLGESFQEKSKLRFDEPVRVPFASLSHGFKKGIELLLVFTK